MQFFDSWRGGGTGTGAYIFKPQSTTQVAVTVDGLSTSGANDILFRVRNSAGTVLFSVDNSGNIAFAGSGTITIDTTVTGNLTVNGNTTLGNSISQDTLTVSAAATFNGTTTFVGVPSFSTLVTLNNGLTVNGTTNLNGQVNFNGTTAYTGPVLFADGTAASPSISFASDTDTGIYRAAADQLGFAVAGAVELTLNATNLSPGANDGSALGVSGTAWADLFLAAGAVIDIGAGDVTLTGGTNLLTMAGGDFQMSNDLNLTFGTTIAAATATLIQYDTAETVDALKIGVDETSRRISIVDYGDIGTDTTRTARSHPTLALYAATFVTGDYVEMFMDGTNAVINVGPGATNGGMMFMSDNANTFYVNNQGTFLLYGSASGYANWQTNPGAALQIRSNLTTSTSNSGFNYINDSSGSTGYSASSGTQVHFNVNYPVNQSGTAAMIGLRIEALETSQGSGTSYLFRALAGAAGTTEMFSVRNTGDTAITQAAVAAGRVAFTLTPGAHTAMTAEVLDFSLVARSVTLTDTTTIALARSTVLGATTYVGVAAGGTETVTTAVNLEVGLPVQGANLTLTNAPISARFLGNTVIGNMLTPAAGPTNTLFVASGTAPTSTTADSVAFYSSDISAGNTEPSFYCEGTAVLATGQADSVSSVRVKMRINGTEVTLLAI